MAKKKVTPNAKVVAVFTYTSVCCDAPAKKPPVERSASDRSESKYSECSLGKWDCVKCAKRCKVTRSRAKESDGGPASTQPV